MPDGICPFAVWRGTKNYGYPKGTHGQNQPLVVVDHIMGGYKSTMDNLDWLDNSGISAHFGIGPGYRNISQYVNILDASYASGVVGQSPRGNRRGIDLYDRANPLLAQIEREAKANWYTVDTSTGPKWTLSINGVNAWNGRSISKEHQGVNQNTPWDDGMVESSIAINLWINEELTRLGMPTIDFANGGLIGHFNIDHIDRPYCPGPGRPYDYILQQSITPTSGGEEVFNRVPQEKGIANPEFWHNKQLAQGAEQGMNCRKDFDLPINAKEIELEMFLYEGGVDLMDGGVANGLAGYVSAGDNDSVRLKLDENGMAWFRVVQACRIDMIRCVGYYT